MDMRRVVGPMVNQSDAPFRVLCLKYGATCAYSEMLYSSRIVREAKYLDAYVPACDAALLGCFCPESTTGLVVQICGNDPDTLASAAVKIAETGRAAAIDLNLGCPQDRAQQDLFGSFLLDQCHWPVVFSCVCAMSTALEPFHVRLFCKIRLIEGHNVVEQTEAFCRGLIDSGCQLITIHGRTRGSTRHRRAGPADIAAISCIARNLADRSARFVSNGNIRCGHDVRENTLKSAPCVGIMSAEGILRNPCLFQVYICQQDDVSGESSTGIIAESISSSARIIDDGFFHCQKCNNLSKRTIPDLYTIFEEYCLISERYRELGGWEGMDEFEQREESRQVYIARQHLMWMLGKSGHGRSVRYKHLGSFYRRHCDLLNELNSACNMDALLFIARNCLIGCWW